MFIPFLAVSKSALKKRFWIHLTNCTVLISILVLFATRSRTGILSILVFIVFISLQIIRKKSPKITLRLILPGIICSGALIIVGMKTFHSGLTKQIPHVLFASRLHNWEEGIRISTQYPLLGTGTGSNVYNTYLQFLNQYGLFGLTVFFVFLGFTTANYINNKRQRSKGPFHEGIFWSVVSVLIAGMGESVLGNQLGYLVLYLTFLLI
jgi:O-antigen ligase